MMGSGPTHPGESEVTTERDGHGADLGSLAVVVVATTVLAIGAGTSTIVSTALCVLAGAGFAVGVTRLESTSNLFRAAGSCLVLGSLVVVLAVVGSDAIVETHWLASGLAVGAFTAVAATGLALTRRRFDTRTVVRASRSAAVTGAGTSVVLVVVSTVSLVTFFGVAVGVVTTTPFFGFVSLLFLAGLVLYMVAVVGSFLEETRANAVALVTVEQLFEMATVRDGLWVYLAGAAVAAFVLVQVAVAFDAVLESMGPVGVVLDVVFTSGVVHWTLLVLLGILSVILVVVLFEPMGRQWLEPYPLRTLSFGAGGFAVPIAIAVGGLIAEVGGPIAILSVPVTALVATVVAWMLCLCVESPYLNWLSSRRRLLAVGTGTVFLLVVGGATDGLAGALVFVGVAGTIVAWDVGANALSMRRDLGNVDSREVELLSVTGTLAVGCVGVALAAVAYYGVGAASPPADRLQALPPIVLALAGVLAFTLVALEWPTGGSISSSASTWLGHPELVERGPLLYIVSVGIVLGLGLGGDERLLLVLVFVHLPIAVYYYYDERVRPMLQPHD